MKTRIVRIDPKELRLIEVNARYMRHEEYRLLVNNIKRDGKLTSVPFACLDEDGKYLVLSGNHRTMAAIDAGLQKIDVMVTDEKLTNQQRIAIQLSHNAIVGQDDPVILKQLYEELNEVDWKIYSGLDDVTLEMLDKVESYSLSEPNLDFRSVSVIFFPDELNEAQEVLDEALALAKGIHGTWLARHEEYDKWLDALDVAGAAAGIKNNATALKIVLDIFKEHIDDLAAYYEDETRSEKNWVPVSPLIKTNNIPLTAANTVKRALDKMQSRGEVTKNNLWQALEIWATDYLDNK